MLMVTILGVVKNSDGVESKKIIGSDTTWKKTESPYIITDSIIVFSGVTLTIEPGVIVKFEKDKALDIYGTLIARGTPDEKITFTRNTSDNWGYIYFSDSSTDAVYNDQGDYTSGSILEHCIVEYAGSTSVGNNGAVRLENAHPFINYCTIQNNSAAGINGWSLSGTLIIDNTGVHNNTDIGIAISSGGTTNILHSTISKNNGGINIGSSGTTNITNNTIDSNIASGGIYINIRFNNSTANVSNNIISNNTSSQGGGIFAYSGETSVSDFSNNIIYNNVVSYSGGGIFSYGYGGGKVNISHNIIGNNASSSSSGGGVCAYYDANWSDGVVKVDYNSIIGNAAKNVPSISYDNYRGYNDEKDIKYNTITNNKATDDNNSAVWISNKPPVFNYNNILGNNTTYELWYGNAKGSYGWLDAQHNWWGTSNEDEIAGKIHDYGDDASYDIVNYYNYDTAIRTDAPISPPTGLTAMPGNGQISLSWNANQEADTTGYKVYWNTTSGFPYTNSADVGNQTNYTITGLPTGEYYVTVTAYDNQYLAANDDPKTIVNDNQTNGNESWFADEQHVTVSTTGTFPPKAITKPATNIGANSATLNGAVNTYGIQSTVWFEYGTTSGSLDKQTKKKTLTSSKDKRISMGVTGLTPKTTYYFRIVANNVIRYRISHNPYSRCDLPCGRCVRKYMVSF